MYKTILLVLILLFSISCGNQNNMPESELASYEAVVARILNIPKEDLYIPLTFANDLDNKNGICRLKEHLDIGIHIKIHRENWKKMDESTRYALIAHEMLHCYKGMDHIEHPLYKVDALMSPYTSDSGRCVKALGLEKCIEESFRYLEKGIIKSLFIF